MKRQIKKRCKYCNNIFFTGKLNKIYCSEQCKITNDYDRDRKYYAKKRENYKKDFLQGITKEESEYYYNLKHKSRIVICKYCGKEFVTNVYTKSYCSKECRYKNNAIINRKKLKIHNKKLCKECNKEFIERNRNHKFCSYKCSENYYYKIKNFLIIDNTTPYNTLIKLRFEILKRDNFQCQYCGRSPKKDGCKLHIDHINPRSKGGTNEPSNLITSCQECNLGKYDILLKIRELKRKNDLIGSPTINENDVVNNNHQGNLA